MEYVFDDLIELRGLRFHYRDWQSNQIPAPTLILLHGFTGHARSWDFFAESARERFRVLALDQRGHGETEWARDGKYGIHEMSSDLQSFLKAMHVSEYCLVGLSMGGMVGMHFAAQRPNGLKKLVIVDIAPEIASEGERNVRDSVVAQDEFESVEEAFENARRVNPVPPEDVHHHRVRYSLMRTENGNWTYRYDRAFRRMGTQSRKRPDPEEGWRALSRVNVPTLLIKGENSTLLTDELAQRFVNTVPDSSLVVIQGSGHSVPLDKPVEFGKTVLEFL